MPKPGNLLAALLMLCAFTSRSQEPVPLINSTLLIEQGVKLHNEGKYREAIEVYDRIGSADSNYVLALYEKALACQADSLFAQGLAYCEEGLRLTADRQREPELYSLYGSIIDDMGEYDRAVRILDSAIARYPAHTSLYVNKGISLINLKQYDKAEKMLQRALLMDPYSSGLHYYLGRVALNKGKIVPAMLSYASFLLIAPEARNSRVAINILSSIANNENAVTELVAKRTDDLPANFQLVEQIVSSKIALDKSYRKLISLDDNICRQLQVVMEKLEYDENDKDFYMQFYVPLFKKIFADKQFEPFIYYIFSGVDLDPIKSYHKKNKKEVQQFINNAVAYLNTVRSTRELHARKRENVKERYFYEKNKISSYGHIEGEVYSGNWTYYYPAGNIKAQGLYSATSQKEGLWKYYYFNGRVDGEELNKNGKLEGPSKYYYDNGILMFEGSFVNGKRQGEFRRYFRTGALSSIENYHEGVLQGKRKSYYATGVLNVEETYKDDKNHGPYTTYYENGKKEKTGNFENGKLSGPYNAFHDNGEKAIEGTYADNMATGTWKRYHRNGKLKSVENYLNNLLDGEYAEYHDNGQLFTKYMNKKGKTAGEAVYYDEDGKLFSILVFENDKVRTAKYFDKTGKQISVSEGNKKIQLTSYTPHGYKRTETFYNEKGNTEGERKYFFTSGTLKESEMYRDGSLEGLNVAYHPNKLKRYELSYQEGKKDGYYTGYFIHGSKQQEGWYVDNQAQGAWREYDEQARLSEKLEYLNDELHGVRTSYWPNGKKDSETYYEEGIMTSLVQFDTLGKVINTVLFNAGTGKMTLLHVNGKKYVQGAYKYNKPDGEWKTFYFDGSIQTLKFFKNGKQDSIYREFFYGGKPSLEGHFVSGAKAGEWKYYKKSGKLNSVEQYEDGELSGQKTYYHENGQIELTIDYQKGQRHGYYKRYDEKGILMVQVKYEHGSPMSYTYLGKDNKLVPEISLNAGNGKVRSFYPNGNKACEFEFVDDVLNNGDNLFFADGKPMMVSTEAYGNTENELKYYNADGSTRSVFQFSHDEEHGPFKEYSSKGILKSEGHYDNGQVHGKLKYYDEKGKLTETYIFYYGQLLEVRK